MDAALYWELRTRAMEHAAMVERSNRELKVLSERVEALIRQAGLDPQANYTWNDADCSLTPAPPLTAPQAHD